MTLRVYFGLASLAVLVLCITNYYVEYTPEWKTWQKGYHTLLAERIDDPGKAAREARTPPKFAQIYNQELGVADRCVICHLGMDNPLMKEAPNPHKAHPGTLLATHPYQQIGCTICHQGQGAATTLADAHGDVRHWEKPLLRGDFVQATCTKCHHEEEIPGAPVVNRGKRLLGELGCSGCHRLGETARQEKVGPRLAGIGSKVSRRWLNRWLSNPKGYLPAGKMPDFQLAAPAANALAAYLMTSRDEAIDAMPQREGDYDAGDQLRRDSQCVVCHVTVERGGQGVGGRIGPDLLKIGNKANQRWLSAFFTDPHKFYPNTKMPRFNFTEQQALDLAQFAIEEWVDYDLLDLDEAAPELPPDPPERIEQGRRLYDELGCAGCHELTEETTQPPGPDLTFIGSKPVHDLDFGEARVRHTLPDFLYTKLKSPRKLSSRFRLPLGEDPAEAIWKNLQPTALFSNSAPLPEGSQTERLAWILQAVQERTAPPAGWQSPEQAPGSGAEGEEASAPEAEPGPSGPPSSPAANRRVDPKLELPQLPPQEQATWLVDRLNEAGLLNPLKMPHFRLDNAEAEALTIALMSHSAERVASGRFEVPRKRKVVFNPKDEFGQLERRYRCLSCHGIRGSGVIMASDLTFEGSRVNREWLKHYLNNPYGMRRTFKVATPLSNILEQQSRSMEQYGVAMPLFNIPDEQAKFMTQYGIAMPKFNFPEEEADFMAEYMSRVFVDSRIGAGWKEDHSDAEAVRRGKELFDAKGCLACHQVHDKGGDVGPILTTQVSEFPRGTWIGDKLRGEWIYQWLKDPHCLVPGALEPDLGLSDEDALDLTAYLLSLKNPDFQGEGAGESSSQEASEPDAAVEAGRAEN